MRNAPCDELFISFAFDAIRGSCNSRSDYLFREVLDALPSRRGLLYRRSERAFDPAAQLQLLLAEVSQLD